MGRRRGSDACSNTSRRRSLHALSQVGLHLHGYRTGISRSLKLKSHACIHLYAQSTILSLSS